MEAVLDAWKHEFGAWAESLMASGHEGILLEPLAGHPGPALALVDELRTWDNHRQRKIAATIVGYLAEDAPVELLDDMLGDERARFESDDDILEQALSQSVVEDLVFAASRWCRSDSRRDAGVEFCQRVISDAMNTPHWNTASYAMCTLMLHAPGDETQQLLDQFAEFAQGPDGLAQEREFSSALLRGEAITVIEDLLRDREEQAAEAIEFDPSLRADAEKLLEIAAKTAHEG